MAWMAGMREIGWQPAIPSNSKQPQPGQIYTIGRLQTNMRRLRESLHRTNGSRFQNKI